MTEEKIAGGLRHLGVIADGNRRWARERGLATIEGHKKGIDTIEELVEAAGKAGIEYVTFYVFSTENWGRSKDEVGYIMRMVETQILEYVRKLKERGARFLVLGSKDRLSEKVREVLEKAEEMTAEEKGITVCFCFNYGGENEIADAATAAIEAGLKKIEPRDIRERLYHPEVPDVDLVVRTSGEERISGFMLWRVAYAEFLFLDKYFPEMTGADIEDIIEEFKGRQRRFGK